MEVENVEENLPPRQPDPARPLFKNIRKEQVLSNCYYIRLDKPVDLHHYELKFFVENERGSKDLSQGFNNDAGNERRRKLLYALCIQMMRSNPELFVDPLKFVYDCGALLVSVDKIELKENPQQIDLDAALLDNEVRAYLPFNIQKLYAIVKSVGEMRIEGYHVDSTSERGRLALQLLEVVYNQKIIADGKFHVFPQKVFLKETPHRQPIEISGRVIKEGLSKNVRVCTKQGKNGLLLQAEVAKSAFYPEDTLLNYLLRKHNVRDARDLSNAFCSNASKISADIKRLTLITTHLKKNRIFVCDGLDDVNADQRTFTINNEDDSKRQQVSVVSYMESKYRLTLQCRNMPCVVINVRRGEEKTKTYFPIDVLKIVGGQRVPLQKMDGRFQDEMIKKTRMNPDQMKEATKQVITAAVLTGANPYAKRFNAPLDSNAIVAEAELLPSPAIRFQGNAIEEPDSSGRLSWRPPQNRKFLVGGSAKKWLVVNYNRAVGDGRILEDFVKQFTGLLSERGCNINARPEIIAEGRFDRIAEQAKAKQLDFVMVVTRDKMDPVHDLLKHFEISSKIVTQHLWERTVFNVVSKKQHVTLENVIMKTNEKLGGTNFVAVSSGALNNLTGMRRILEEKWFGEDRLFIGLELSRGALGAKGVGKLPTVVGMAYNVDENLSLTGHYFFREASNTVIDNLAQEFEKPIGEYKQRSKGRKWPRHIFIYRAGVSEGEYKQVISVEKNALLKCFDSLASRYPDFVKPGFTFIVAQRNSGFRLIPTTSNPGARGDADRNLKPGTFISKGIVNPNLEQFIGVSHKTLQGTARPILYTVLADQGKDGGRIPTEELRYMTYALAHLHCNVLGTIAVPSIMHHAGQVAKRGSKNLKVDLFGSVDDASTNSSSKNNQGPAGADFAENLSKRLKPTIPTKYWA